MNRRRLGLSIGLVCLLFAGVAQTQESISTAPEPSTPRWVQFSGVLKDRMGQPRTGVQGITFALYKDQEGGTPLWLETQNVSLDEQGRYSVLLGSATTDGLPLELFTTGEARWLGIQVNLPGEVEQSRVLLVSVPYALKAADAETLGGQPLSAFVLASEVVTARVRNSGGLASGDGIQAAEREVFAATGGTIGRIAKFTTTTELGDSIMTESGSNIGIGTTSPGARLHLYSTPTDTSGNVANVLGQVTANPSGSSSAAYLGGWFQAYSQSGNANNITGTLYGGALQFYHHGSGTLSNGVGFGLWMENSETGTISSTRGLDIGGNNASSGTIADYRSIYVRNPANAGTLTNNYGLFLDPQTGGTNNYAIYSAGGRNYFGGNVGIGVTNPSEKLDIVGNLKVSGTITGTGSQTISSGNLSISAGNLVLPNTASAGSAGVLTLGGNRFLHNFGSGNTFIGQNAGNFTMTGSFNTASGMSALGANTTGSSNTASGNGALLNNTTGNVNTASGDSALLNNATGNVNTASGASALLANNTGSANTASGYAALVANTTGNNNTAVGLQAGVTGNPANGNTTGSNNTFIGYNTGPGVPSASNLQNATAIGANAVVSANNSLVLGSINGVNGATSGVNVGIGTENPSYPLDVGNSSAGTAYININAAAASQTGLQFMSAGTAKSLIYRPGSSNDLRVFSTTVGDMMSFQNSTGNVGIGTTVPGFKLDVQGGQVNASGGLCMAGDCRANWAAVGGGGGGTVTSVGSGLGLTGGPITTTGTLSIDTAVVPRLNTTNNFAGNQSITGNLQVSGSLAVGGGSSITNSNDIVQSGASALTIILPSGTSIPAATCVAQPVGASGATTSMAVVISPAGDPSAMGLAKVIWRAFVSTNGIIIAEFCKFGTGTALSTGNQSFNIRVLK